MSTDRQDAENPPLQGRSAEQADNAATPVRPEGHARPGRASRLKALLEQGRIHSLAVAADARPSGLDWPGLCPLPGPPHEYASSVLCSPAILASAFPRPFASAGSL